MKNHSRQYTMLDQLCLALDKKLKQFTVQKHYSKTAIVERANPAAHIAEAQLTKAERCHAAGLMRVNHVGEVCAQALYKGQAITARLDATREAMQQAANEELDHLRWCAQRVVELGSHTSLLNPLWYTGAFTIGFVAGAVGDQWSLGFVAETEKQVVVHLEEHMQKLPEADNKSQAIVKQMRDDEAEHADMAVAAGAADLPVIIKRLMRLNAKIMTATAYYI